MSSSQTRTRDSLIQRLKDANIDTLVFDWDLTILGIHTGGFVPRSSLARVASKVSEDWLFFMEGARATNFFTFHVATFSDRQSYTMIAGDDGVVRTKNGTVMQVSELIAGEELVRTVLNMVGETKYGNKDILQPASVWAFFPDLYQLPEQYSRFGMSERMPLSKSYHLKCVSKYASRSAKRIALFDDDSNNVTQAVCESFVSFHVSGGKGFAFNSLREVFVDPQQ